uniref:Uncharacterized protein n=1 Tax=mine drainage metagenome TaxID=410659 RepID=E6QIH1_9ZZZZ
MGVAQVREVLANDAPPGTAEYVADKEDIHAFAPLSSLLSDALSCFSGRSSGKRMTSRMDLEPVSSMVRRSMPMPSPAVGGRP